jgi:hypothetical protein
VTADRDALGDIVAEAMVGQRARTTIYTDIAAAVLAAGYEPPGSYARGVADGRAVVEAGIERLHGGTHWCFDEDEQNRVYELGLDPWPCPTLDLLASHGGASDAGECWCGCPNTEAEYVARQSLPDPEQARCAVVYPLPFGRLPCGKRLPCPDHSGGASDAAVVQAVNTNCIAPSTCERFGECRALTPCRTADTTPEGEQ